MTNPQHPLPKSDNAFTRRMRFHQSWYREHVLKVPYGTGPYTTSTTEYGNMLTQESADAGLNFLTPEIFEAVKTRVAEAEGLLEPFRLMRNMLSSQPLCFNLFGYLGLHLDLATRWLATVIKDEVKAVTRIVVEHAPEPKSEYLNDHTAFDSYIEYEDVDGRHCFLGIETKLTEPFSQKEYDTPEYRRWMDDPTTPWRENAWDKVAEIQHNQLWRDHLLAVSMMCHPKSEYAHGRLMLARHPGDEKCAKVTVDYQDLLNDRNDSFVDMPFDKIADTLAGLGLNTEQEAWLAAFKLRYLDLAASQETFDGR